MTMRRNESDREVTRMRRTRVALAADAVKLVLCIGMVLTLQTAVLSMAP